MSVNQITALKRTENGKKTRNQGFIPAVVYGRGITTETIKLDKNLLVNILKKCGEKAKLNLVIDEESRVAIIKDIDKKPITNEILHMDLQLVDNEEIVRWDIPIVYEGKEQLEAKRFLLVVNEPQIEVVGKVKDIPDSITVDIRQKNRNDIITIEDLNLHPEVSPIKPNETIVSVIK
ncbi:MAG: 50S ribosomal protein L25 [Epulopiscium sp.]|nr:50S ribosomal protein L25 [Candidatus Epulonipiscium sp.]